MTKLEQVPAVGTDEWKTYVADAIEKPPSRRSEAERETLREFERMLAEGTAP